MRLFLGVALFLPVSSLVQAEGSGQEEISFQSGGHTLKGTLLLPRGPGPHPAVAFVHGTGPLDRHHPSLHPALREHWARKGIASLVWDKPGTGASEGDWSRQSFRDRAEEALAAVRFLQGCPGIDPKRVGLWGISQGGWVCPLSASLSKEVAFLILVSAPACTVEAQDLYRIEQGMLAAGRPEAEIGKALAFARRRIVLVRDGTFEALDAAQRKVAEEPWFREYVHRLGSREFAFGKLNVDYDPGPALEGVGCPVLVVVGGRDTEVPAREGAVRIREILRKAGNRDVTVETFPDAGHFLDGAAQGLAPGYASMLTEWVSKQKK